MTHRSLLLGASALACLLLGSSLLSADEPSRLGRLFRFGGSTAPAPATAPAPVFNAAPPPQVMATPRVTADTGVPLSAPLPPVAAATSEPSPRILPQPRNYRGVTDSDPLVTRISLARTTEGTGFGMFLQVFADGTIIDGEGVHEVGREALTPLLRVLNADDLYRLKGHCGAPPTDFIEDIHVVVFERGMRGLRANSFSFSGNPQGCDPSVRRLQAVLDALQASFGRAAVPADAGAPTPAAPAGRELRLNDGLPQPGARD